MHTMDTSTLYRYINIPQFWGSIGADRIDISPLRYSKILEGFSKLPKNPVKILVIGQIAPLINNIIEQEGINTVFGINFQEYFAGTFKQEEFDLRFSKYSVIYNVGYEKALNKDFSKQILLGLVQNFVDKGSHVLIQSFLPLKKLRDDYGIDFQNVVVLPELPDDKLF